MARKRQTLLKPDVVFQTIRQAHSVSLPLQQQVAFERWLRTGVS